MVISNSNSRYFYEIVIELFVEDDVKEYVDDEELQQIIKEKEHSAIVTRKYFLTTILNGYL
ncbi:hypothetical protein [Clostridium saccharobutylicum]|uniref:Uncharacterized protein n=1 Tax=Clostridium saccharobutylicum DSM 13864 TaxID=1345695 RepID=U5MSP2_CLOSA|nr:hypothetical protein [Clostridium saccharobutylicum]AGX42427.1 hypothetical protein CLSA_c14260 [Clostridium saccharobutylicum DSM 13864]AQR89712.1 hypothetical protein CLOSC_14150 [Clostridium saccharobutylicum]AQR99614.1 hypothetical protein CSACC_14230 [Clostridium saccharobutylicum]AQS09344.1 hypothetical protein CLOBY_14710 [Clostridium saccharobutylicum]AQS13600.1 hypothetical protein CLOSACC_14230 [Clostridium saccharobutylicum]